MVPNGGRRYLEEAALPLLPGGLGHGAGGHGAPSVCWNVCGQKEDIRAWHASKRKWNVPHLQKTGELETLFYVNQKMYINRSIINSWWSVGQLVPGGGTPQKEDLFTLRMMTHQYSTNTSVRNAGGPIFMRIPKQLTASHRALDSLHAYTHVSLSQMLWWIWLLMSASCAKAC